MIHRCPGQQRGVPWPRVPFQEGETNGLRSNAVEKHPGTLADAEMNPSQLCGLAAEVADSSL